MTAVPLIWKDTHLEVKLEKNSWTMIEELEVSFDRKLLKARSRRGLILSWDVGWLVTGRLETRTTMRAHRVCERVDRFR